MSHTVDPFFFGSGQRRLFGCAFVPEQFEAGVVLCPPAGHEYITTHRMMRRLASRLAEEGLLVLRFDYSGTGDSAGDFGDARLKHWIEDIALAQGTLKARFRVRRISLVGLRLGATLALLADQRRQEAGSLVLWDPVADGCLFLETLRAREHERLRPMGKRAPRRQNSQDSLELFGFRYSSQLLEEIEALDFRQLDDGPGSKTLLIDGSVGGDQQPLAAQLSARGIHVDYQHLPDAESWSVAADRVVIPGRTIEGIVGWVTESTG